MIMQFLDDIKKAISAGACFSALSLIFTLPDICVKAEKGTTNTKGKDYIEWWDKNMVLLPDNEEFRKNYSYIDGETAYQIRCHLLHQGSLSVNKDKINNKNCKFNEIILKIETKNDCQICYVHCVTQTAKVDENLNVIETYPDTIELNINEIYFFMKQYIEKYYSENKEKFSFMKYKVVRQDLETNETYNQNIKLI